MSGMSGELIGRLLFSCKHQFSWPRQAEDGQHYQVCVHCGTTYKYDWSRMRRIARVPSATATVENISRRKCKPRATWTPRSRRLRHQVPVLVRAVHAGQSIGSELWIEGTTENVSASGLLLRASSNVEVGTTVELKLEMPREITGGTDAQVLCLGTVVRATPVSPDRKGTAHTFIIACSISGYSFMIGPRQIAS